MASLVSPSLGCRSALPLLPLLLLLGAGRLGWSDEGRNPAEMLEHLEFAQQALTEAFSIPEVEREKTEDLIRRSLGSLEALQPFVARVMQNGGQAYLFNDKGELEYELSDEDMVAVQGYMDGFVFILPDLLPLVLSGSSGAAHLLAQEDSHPVLRKKSIVQFFRLSWWLIMTAPSSAMWVVPIFGALASVARSLRAFRPDSTDPYRELLWNATLGGVDSEGWGSEKAQAWMSSHFRVIQEPLHAWRYSRSLAFRRSCAWLAISGAKSAVEAAERHVKAFEGNSLKTILEAAADWPVFDLLQRLASRSSTLLDDSEEGDEGHTREDGGGIDRSADGRRHRRAKENEPDDGDTDSGVAHEQAADQVSSELLPQRLPANDVLEMYRMVHVFGALCDSFGIRWWVSHGTLLGALRDIGLSRHTDDSEVDVAEGDMEMMQGERMRRALGRNGYELSYDPRGRCFKVWPVGSRQAAGPDLEDVLLDQTWWLPQQFVGSPALDVYVVETPESRGQRDRHYVSNEEFHCNERVCTQVWRPSELASFASVPFGSGHARVPVGAATYLGRVYGDDWNTTIRPHRWASHHGLAASFVPIDVQSLSVTSRRASPTGPLPVPLLPL
mmetsp:Transcript_9473/g.33530  ORF Transcript_9473/g.33530 Transcript_9473/m.33530 type:complete len:613 (+) Transcript_9473:51-1889(+)